jgi:hypothetical protein
MRLPGNGVHAPVAGSIVAGSQMGVADDEKSPARAAAVGTENVRVCERRTRPSRLIRVVQVLHRLAEARRHFVQVVAAVVGVVQHVEQRDDGVDPGTAPEREPALQLQVEAVDRQPLERRQRDDAAVGTQPARRQCSGKAEVGSLNFEVEAEV